MAAPPPLAPRPPRALQRRRARAPPAPRHCACASTGLGGQLGGGGNYISAQGALGVVVSGWAGTAWQPCSGSGWAGVAAGQEAALALRSPESAAPFQTSASSRWLRAQASPLPRPALLRQGPAPPVGPAPGSPRSAAAGNGDPRREPREPRADPAPEKLSPQTPSASREKTAGTLTQAALILLGCRCRAKGRRMEEAGGKKNKRTTRGRSPIKLCL